MVYQTHTLERFANYVTGGVLFFPLWYYIHIYAPPDAKVVVFTFVALGLVLLRDLLAYLGRQARKKSVDSETEERDSG